MEYNFGNIPIEAYGADPVATGFMAGGMLIYSFIIMIVVYVIMAVALMKIAQKTGFDKKAWWAWIPILNIVLMLNIAGLSGWFALLFLIGAIPILGAIVLIIFSVYIWMKISKACGKPDYLGILMIVPIVNMILPLYLAFADSRAVADTEKNIKK